MSLAHLHILLNHFPVFATFFGAVLMVVGVLKKNRTLTTTALITFIISALVTIPVFFSGPGAEESLKNEPTVTENVIEKHETAAGAALICVEILGIFSFVQFVAEKKKHRSAMHLQYVIIFLAMVAFVLMAITASLGGQIRHTEIRPGVDALAGGATQVASGSAGSDEN